MINPLSSKNDLVGLLPAGGRATRISPIPLSKEIFPVGFHASDSHLGLRPKVVAHYLLEKMQLAGAQKAFFILRCGKWDIPAYFADGGMVGLPLGYLIMDLPYGVPFTLDQAFPFLVDSTVLFGFPDILFQPQDAFVQLLARQTEVDADLVLGLFGAEQPHKMDMVDLDRDGRLVRVVIKPLYTRLRYTWIIAVWSPRFTRFMHDFVANQKTARQENLGAQELYMGEVIQAALKAGLRIDNILFDSGSYVDIGTPNDLLAAINGNLRVRQLR